nr:hypothetical transcript [Hymenolepis microstoma]
MNPSVRSLYFSPLVESSRSRKGEIRQNESDGSLEDRPLIIDAEWGRIANSPVSQDEKEEETVRSEELPKEPTIVQKEKRQEYSIPVAFPQRSISHPVESGDDYDTESDTEALNPQRRAQSCNQLPIDSTQAISTLQADEQVSEVSDDRSEIETNERLLALLSDFDLHEVKLYTNRVMFTLQ